MRKLLTSGYVGLLGAMLSVASAATIDFGPYSGAVSDSSAVVLYRLDQSGVECRLVLSVDSDLGDPLYSETVTSSSSTDNVVKLKVEGLEPLTEYHYGLEMDGESVREGRGMFKTFPAGEQSFSFAFGNSLRDDTPEMSESGLAAALENEIAFFMCTGDFFYEDIKRNDVGVFRSAYHSSLKRGPDALMGRTVPFVFIWDDHDYGPNNSDAGAPGREASRQVYREAIPHYSLPAGDGDNPIYQAFSVGTVRFILTDLRSERDDNWDRDNENKSMMGETQLQWFFNELLASSPTHDLIFWVSSVPYTARESRGGDHWGGFTTERTRIANFIKDNEIKNLMIVSGDAHSLAATDGSNSDYADGGGAPLAEVIAAPLDGSTSVKGGPWTEGTWRAPSSTNAYGLITVEMSAAEVTVKYSGRDHNHKEKISLTKRFARDVTGIQPSQPEMATSAPFTVSRQGDGKIALASADGVSEPTELRIFTSPGRVVKRMVLRRNDSRTLRLAPGIYNIRWEDKSKGVGRITRLNVR